MAYQNITDVPLRQRRAAAWWVGLFGLPFIAFASWLVFAGIWPEVSDWSRMSRWQPGEATVLTADLAVRSSGRGGGSREATATYRYTVGGQEYTGQRVGIARGSDNVGRYQADMAHALQASLQRGEPVRIWVNPANPQEAVVYRHLHKNMLAIQAAFAMAMGSAGLGLVVAALWLRRAKRGETHGGGKARGGAPGLARKYDNVWLHQAPGGVRLRLPYGRDLARHTGAIVGGIAFFGMGLAIWTFLVGRDEVVPAIFAVVFGLLGLALLATSLFTLTTSLQAELDQQRGIRVRRCFLGLPLHSHQVPPEAVKRLELKFKQTTEHRGREIAWYRLLAHLKNGGTIALTDSLEGEAAARGLFEQVVALSGYRR